MNKVKEINNLVAYNKELDVYGMPVWASIAIKHFEEEMEEKYRFCCEVKYKSESTMDKLEDGVRMKYNTILLGDKDFQGNFVVAIILDKVLSVYPVAKAFANIKEDGLEVTMAQTKIYKEEVLNGNLEDPLDMKDLQQLFSMCFTDFDKLFLPQ